MCGNDSCFYVILRFLADPLTCIHIVAPKVKMGHGAAMGLLVLGTFVVGQIVRTLDDVFLTKWTDASQRRLNSTTANVTANTTANVTVTCIYFLVDAWDTVRLIVD